MLSMHILLPNHTNFNQSTESTGGDGCIEAFKEGGC